MVRSQTDRLSEKTVERQFLYELEADFELAPATSRALLSAAQQVLMSCVRGGELREGQMQVTVVSSREPAGKPLTAMKKLSVVVTVDGGLEDLAVLQQHGAASLRRVRLLRMTEEAMDQDGVLTQEDLARLLQTGVRTVRRDVAQLRADGHWVPTRGVVQDTGRGQSHKTKIVEMYLQRMTYSEIARRAHHSAAAIKRYVQTFGRVLVLWAHDVREAGEIAYVVGISARLAGEYLALRERYANAQYADRLEELAGQACLVLPRNGEEKGGFR
jgi:hypothetical protein